MWPALTQPLFFLFVICRVLFFISMHSAKVFFISTGMTNAFSVVKSNYLNLVSTYPTVCPCKREVVGYDVQFSEETHS